jgi:small subunit ribosomal protein S6
MRPFLKGFEEALRQFNKGKATMPLYEHIFLARQDVSAQQVEALVEQFRTILETGGGSVAKIESWGLKNLTYRIRKNRKAHFTLFNIESEPAAVAEMERQQRLNEDVLRSLTLRVDEHEEGPSAMMQKRDDRSDRRGRFGDRDRGDRDRGERRGGGDRDRPRRDDNAPAAQSAPATDGAS